MKQKNEVTLVACDTLESTLIEHIIEWTETLLLLVGQVAILRLPHVQFERDQVVVGSSRGERGTSCLVEARDGQLARQWIDIANCDCWKNRVLLVLIANDGGHVVFEISFKRRYDKCQAETRGRNEHT